MTEKYGFQGEPNQDCLVERLRPLIAQPLEKRQLAALGDSEQMQVINGGQLTEEILYYRCYRVGCTACLKVYKNLSRVEATEPPYFALRQEVETTLGIKTSLCPDIRAENGPLDTAEPAPPSPFS